MFASVSLSSVSVSGASWLKLLIIMRMKHAGNPFIFPYPPRRRGSATYMHTSTHAHDLSAPPSNSNRSFVPAGGLLSERHALEGSMVVLCIYYR